VDERIGGHGDGHLHVRNGRRAYAQQQPVAAATLAVVILHHRPGLGFAIGAPLIVAAVVTASLAKGRPQRRTAAQPVAP
jgi:hypothetical protein